MRLGFKWFGTGSVGNGSGTFCATCCSITGAKEADENGQSDGQKIADMRQSLGYDCKIIR